VPLSNRGFHCLATENRTRHRPCPFPSRPESENAQESGRYPDYPYLKQFFDKSHITDTDSGVNSFLGFYYTKGQAQDELVHSINSLLQRYSSDTGHKPIGGLMRELQNTGRLAIEELQAACD